MLYTWMYSPINCVAAVLSCSFLSCISCYFCSIWLFGILSDIHTLQVLCMLLELVGFWTIPYPGFCCPCLSIHRNLVAFRQFALYFDPEAKLWLDSYSIQHAAVKLWQPGVATYQDIFILGLSNRSCRV